MAQANLKSKISLDTTAFTAGMRRIKLTASSAMQSVRKTFSGLKSVIGGAVGMAANLAKNIARVGAVAAGITIGAGLAAMAKILKDSTGAAAYYEGLSKTMEALTGSASKTAQILKEVSAFSVVTPFDTTGLQDATNTLLSAGIEADKVVEVLKEISAVSKTTQQVKELADALSKGFAKGKFQTEELNKFLERSINLMPELRKITGKTGDEFQSAIQEGLKFEDVRRAIAAMSAEGGQFFGLLKVQSETTSGLVSTLKSNWDEFLVTFGKPINDAIKPMLTGAISRIQKLTSIAGDLGKKFGDFLTSAYNKITSINFADIGQRLAKGLNMENILELMKASFSVAAAYLGNKMWEAFKSVLDKFANSFGDVVASMTSQMIRGFAEFHKSILNFVKNPLKLFDGDEIASAVSKVLNGIPFKIADQEGDVFGLDKKLERWKTALKAITGPGPLFGPSPSGSPGDRQGAGPGPVFFRHDPNKPKVRTMGRNAGQTGLDAYNDSMTKLNAYRLNAVRKPQIDAAAAGFSGLSELYGMQGDKFQGVAVGSNGVFSNDRARLGIAKGLESGGFGNQRRVGETAKEAEQRKADKEATIADRLDTANELAGEQIQLLKEGLTGA